MRKFAELSFSNSCLSKARPTEMTFVLLSRDAAAPTAIRAWVEERIRLGRNVCGDDQIQEALECAAVMEAERMGRQLEPLLILGEGKGDDQ